MDIAEEKANLISRSLKKWFIKRQKTKTVPEKVMFF